MKKAQALIAELTHISDEIALTGDDTVPIRKAIKAIELLVEIAEKGQSYDEKLDRVCDAEWMIEQARKYLEELK